MFDVFSQVHKFFLLLTVEAYFTCNDTASDKDIKRLQDFSREYFPSLRPPWSTCYPPSLLWKVLKIQDVSSCPWEYRKRTDSMRIPNVLFNATLKGCPQLPQKHCVNFVEKHKLSPNKVGKCLPITMSQLVLMKRPCGNGRYKFIPGKVTLVTGFTCVYSPIGTIPFYPFGKRLDSISNQKNAG